MSTTTLQKAYDSGAQLRDVLNAKMLQPGFHHEDGGVYVLRNDAETIHYIKLLHKREHTLPTLHLLIPTTSVSDEVKVVARLHKVDPGPFQLPMVRKLMDQDVRILREGYLWTTGGCQSAQDAHCAGGDEVQGDGLRERELCDLRVPRQ